MHRLQGGGTKVGRTAEGAIEEAKRLASIHGTPFTPYPCHFCDRWHVGNTSTIEITRRKGRVDVMEVLESGERVAHATRLENIGTSEERMAHIAKRFRAIERRRVSVQS